MARVAVIGGLGFVGTNLVRSLASKNQECVVVDDYSTGLVSNLRGVDCSIIRADISNFKELLPAVQNCEYIFHLAARGSVPRSIKNPRATFEINAKGTLNVLECARVTGAHVAFSSSSSVYGSNSELPKRENMWTGPITPYAASKLACEALIESYESSFGIPCVNYRFFNIFGPWQRPDHAYAAVIPKWIWKAIRNEELEVYGNGEQSRDFTYVEDVVYILIEGMRKQLNHPRPLNLAFGNSIKLSEILNFLLFKHPNLKVTTRNRRSGDLDHSRNSPEKILEEFPNFEPSDFGQALESTYEWFNKHGDEIANGPEVSD